MRSAGVSAAGVTSRRGRRVFFRAVLALILLLGVLLFVSGTALARANTTWYVNAAARPGGQGHSWRSASTSLQLSLIHI